MEMPSGQFGASYSVPSLRHTISHALIYEFMLQEASARRENNLVIKEQCVTREKTHYPKIKTAEGRALKLQRNFGLFV